MKKSKTKLKKDSERPANQGMLKKLRSELKADISSLEFKMAAGFERINGRFENTNARIDTFGARMDGLEAKIDRFGTRVDGLETKIDGLETRMDGFDFKLDSLKSDITAQILELKAEIQKQSAQTHRTLALMEEEQNARRYLFDGFKALLHRQDEVEQRMDAVDALCGSAHNVKQCYKEAADWFGRP